MARQRLDARLRLVVPHLHGLDVTAGMRGNEVVAARGDVRLIGSRIEVQAVDALLVAHQRVVALALMQ